MDKIKVLEFNAKNGFTTTVERSRIMKRVKSKNTKPELKLRKRLWSEGFRYRINYKKLAGSPDIVFINKKLVIFVDGGFWHGYNWEEQKVKLKSNREFWIPKIERNIQRDEINNKILSESGWKVLRFWEHEIHKDFESCIMKIKDFYLKSS